MCYNVSVFIIRVNLFHYKLVGHRIVKKINFKKGFTLIELLVVVAIIGIFSAVVLAALNNSRSKGVDAAVKANLVNAMKQAEIFYSTNTAAPNSYTGVCTNPGPVGGVKTLSAQMIAAAKATGLPSPYYRANPGAPGGTLTTATCNNTATAWVAEAPLETAGQMWCVDSLGRSKQTTASIGVTTVCP